MPLLPILRVEATGRRLLEEAERLDAAAAFRLVRDMPFRPASDLRPETAIGEWRGTSLEKHILLQALFGELGLGATIIIATHEFTPESAAWLPPHLLTEVRLAPLPDVHAFLRLEHDPVLHQWMTVDATWPARARQLELPANLALELGGDQKIACDPIEIFHLPEDGDAAELAGRIAQDFVGRSAARRDAFLRALADWLAAEIGA